MNGVVDPLSELRGLKSFEAVSFWPPAPGWWFLFFLSMILLLLVGRWFWRRHRQRQPMRAAVKELERLQRQQREYPDAKKLVTELSIWLRRVALHRYGRQTVAGLHGREWLQFLDRSAGLDGFCNGPGKILADGPYRPDPQVSAEGLFTLVRQWLKNGHKGS